jgi:hypothetical protein
MLTDLQTNIAIANKLQYKLSTNHFGRNDIFSGFAHGIKRLIDYSYFCYHIVFSIIKVFENKAVSFFY